MKNIAKQKTLRLGLLMAFIIFNAFQVNVLAQALTADHIAKIKTVSGCVISDDGKLVAYTVSVPADPFKENAASKNTLHVLNTTSGITTPYFTSAGVSSVVFRPLKGTITFLSKSSDETVNSIYEMSISGGEASKIFSTTTNILNYSWQPDGKHIAYTVKENSKVPETPLTYKPDFYEEEMGTQKGYIVDLGSEKKETKPLNVNGSIYM
nr:hypothetical protein [Bacteroidia bacterium]